MDVDTEDSSGASFSISSVEAPTDYELYVQAGLGETYCSSPLTWTLTVVPEPLAELTAESTLHCGESFDPGVMFSYEHGSPSWSWSGGELPASFPDSWTVDAYGDQVLTLAVSSDAAGADCVAEKPLDIGLHPQPVADFALVSDSVLCAPGRFEIQDLSQDAVEVTWFVEYVGGWISPGDVLPLLLPIDGSYDMLWVANGTGGCSDTLFEADVFTVLPSPDAGIWSNQPAYVPWSSEGTEFVFNDISVGGDSTIWTIGDSTIVDEDILNFFYDDPGLYALQQQVYNEFGCQDTVSFRFEIIDELAIYVPTAFTPNGDQLNDVWKPVMAGESRIAQYHLMVMGRSGQIMFDTHDYTKGWDAQNTKRTDKLEDVQNNVFTYQLRVLPSATPLHPDPDWLEYTGHVTIVD
jgi:gliding motility-associated-like protein